MKNLLEILNEKYRELQALNHYKQYQIAELIGRDPGQLSRVLKGEGNEEVQKRFIAVLEIVIEHHKLQDQVEGLEQKLAAANEESITLSKNLKSQEHTINGLQQEANETKEILQDKIIQESPKVDNNAKLYNPSRRKLIVGGIMIAILAMLPLLCTKYGKEELTAKEELTIKEQLTIICNYHSGDPILAKYNDTELFFIKQWANEIEALAPGKIEITAIPNEDSTDKYYKDFKKAKDGYDMLHTVTYFQEEDKYLRIFAAIPFGMDSECFDAWFYSEGQEHLKKIQAESDKLELLPLGNTGKQAGGWFFPEIPDNSEQPFKDFEMRIYGLGREVVERLGTTKATGSFLSKEKAETKIIKNKKFGLEYINAHTDATIGYDELAKECNGIFVKEGWQEPGAVWSLLINEKALAKLEKAGIKKHHVEAVTLKYHHLITNAYTIAGKEKLIAWEKQGDTLGFRIEEKFSNELLGRLKRETVEIIKDDMRLDHAGSPHFKTLFESYTEFFEMWTGRSFWE